MIRFNDFIPNWSAIKRVYNGKAPLRISNQYDYHKFGCCPTGEAFGSDKYNYNWSGHYCRTCELFSHDSDKAIRGSMKDFNDFKLQLYTHFLEKHPLKLRGGVC